MIKIDKDLFFKKFVEKQTRLSTLCEQTGV